MIEGMVISLNIQISLSDTTRSCLELFISWPMPAQSQPLYPCNIVRYKCLVQPGSWGLFPHLVDSTALNGHRSVMAHPSLRKPSIVPMTPS